MSGLDFEEAAPFIPGLLFSKITLVFDNFHHACLPVSSAVSL